MYSIKIAFLASVFVDADSITANPDNVTGLLQALKDKTLVPITIHERSEELISLPRIGLMTPGGGNRLVLLGKRFDFARVATDFGSSDLGDLSSFCQEAIPKLIAALDFFDRRAHRLAIVQQGFLPELSKPEMENVVKRIFQFPSIYKTHLPFEWDWRMASLVEREFSSFKEPTNTLVTIKRNPGTLLKGESEKPISEITIDRIRIDFDINTLPQNIKARFDNSHITSFFTQAISWHNDLSSEVFSYLLSKEGQ